VLGSFKSGIAFNYDSLTSGKDYCMIDSVSVSKVASVRDIESNLNPSSYYGLIDFELIKFRQPRQT
jgi:hypothetical protein